MRAEPFVSRILDDEGLTGGLNDPEARLLVEWLVGQVEGVARTAASEPAAWRQVEALCRRGLAIRSFVTLWCYRRDPGAAAQLAAAERFAWPLPASDQDDPFDILQRILTWEQTRGHPPAQPPRTGRP